ncbi:hypothetical protein KKC91_06590 [bacterium]|nr:hypothetical protein [bacterium]
MKTRHRIKRNILYVLNTLLWAFSSFPEIQRKKPININFVFHTEAIANKRIFDKLMDFCKKFFDYTHAKLTLCITTPYCPQTQYQLEKFNVTTGEYGKRVKEISKFTEIGYHGHFFTPLSNKRALAPINHLNYNFQLIKEQMEKEIFWLKKESITPITYVAGWWFLTDDIIKQLEDFGIRVDCSIRRNHTNSFGEKFIDDSKIPRRGEPFILSSSKRIIEIQSIFYPIHHPRLTLNMLKNVMDFRADKELFLVFPSHEGELLDFNREFWANIKMLSKLRYIKWTDLSEMNRLARAEWKL